MFVTCITLYLIGFLFPTKAGNLLFQLPRLSLKKESSFGHKNTSLKKLGQYSAILASCLVQERIYLTLGVGLGRLDFSYC